RVVDPRLDQGAYELTLTLLVEVVEGSLLAVVALRDHPEKERVVAGRCRPECNVGLGAQIEDQPVVVDQFPRDRPAPRLLERQGGQSGVVRQAIRRNGVTGGDQAEQGRVDRDMTERELARDCWQRRRVQ